jgi:hypothetical protein
MGFQQFESATRSATVWEISMKQIKQANYFTS